MTEALLRLTDVVVQWNTRGRGVRALDGVSLALHPGERVGVVGESGSGKTTLVRVLLGLQRVDSGTVERAGVAPGQMPARLVGWVSQDAGGALNPRRTVGRTLSEVSRVHPDLRAVSPVTALEQVGLDAAVLERLPHQLSGGQRQRVALARALLLEPRVLVCDEPTSALDVSVQASVVNLLRDVVDARGLSLLVVGHDLGVMRALCSRLLVMQHGRVVEEGPTEQVLTAPQHACTRALLAALPRA